ncbi:hypothetical protein [Caldimonas sp. KR1-144]|uniref:hypothetical protein n=1 Tax=Caldimonas sp. KR1-144 TaxID=3400911 RepID=UPI003C0CA85F
MQPYLNDIAVRSPVPHEPAPGRAQTAWTPRGSEMSLRLRVGGRLRSARLYRGAADIGCGPLFVLLQDAPCGGSAVQAQAARAFERWADVHGACVVHPAGLAGRWNDGRLHAPSPARRLDVDDVGFVHALVAHLGPQRRSYAVGFGAGGHFVWRLAAQPDAPFAGFVSVGANLARPGDCAFSIVRLGAPVLLLDDGSARPRLHERPTAETLAALRAAAAPGIAVRRGIAAEGIDLAAQIAGVFGEQAGASFVGSLL